MKLVTQEQTACSFTTRQTLLGPQGDGLQGSSGPRAVRAKSVSLQRDEIDKLTKRNLPLLGRQETKAFPVIPGRQLHMGM